jgi:hypothetical protein
LKNGELPEVSWIVPNTFNSEHPPYDVTVGMWYVTTLINRVMQSKFWNDCAIILVNAGIAENAINAVNDGIASVRCVEFKSIYREAVVDFSPGF